MSSVFIGGSRKFSRLNPLVRQRLDSIVDKGLTVLVGDASGADKAVQRYLTSRSYPHVVVYCVGKCRNNVGDWEVRTIPTDAKARGWRYFAQKDLAMAKDATCGFMLWDGESKGTVNNLLNLIHLGKTSLVYVSGQPEFTTIRSAHDLRRTLSVLSPRALGELDSKIDLESRLAAEGQMLPLG